MKLFTAPVLVLVFLCHSTVAHGTIFVRYDADVLPEDDDQPFTYTPPNFDPGSRTVADGILTMEHPGSSGGHEHMRRDMFLDTDLAVFQLRAKYVKTLAPSSGTTAAGIFHARWDGDVGEFLFFFEEDRLRLRTTDPIVDRFIPFDTSDFHTYTIVKNRRENLQLFTDGQLAMTVPFSELSGGNAFRPFQYFQGNPLSVTQWDFVQYALGDDALKLIPVPEPSSLLMLLVPAVCRPARMSFHHSRG